MSDPAEDPRAALARLIAAETGITPPASRQAANWAAVLERAAASPTATAASAAATSTRAAALLVGGLVVGIGVAALWPGDRSPEPRAPIVVSAETSSPTETTAPVLEQVEDPLATIREAYLELRARRPAAALAASERYIRRWPDGMLIAEAEAARVLALCALEHGDAEPARQAFLRRWPRSLHGDRLKNNCRPMTDRVDR